MNKEMPINQSFINANSALSANVYGDFKKIPLKDIAPPPGMIVMWFSDSNIPPVGWAFCDGTDGRPNLQTRFPMGTGNPNYPFRSTGGEENVTLKMEHMPSHNHTLGRHSNDGSNICTKTADLTCPDIWNWNAGANSQTSSTGGDQPHNNMPPYCVIKYIIKL